MPIFKIAGCVIPANGVVFKSVGTGEEMVVINSDGSPMSGI